ELSAGRRRVRGRRRQAAQGRRPALALGLLHRALGVQLVRVAGVYRARHFRRRIHAARLVAGVHGDDRADGDGAADGAHAADAGGRARRWAGRGAAARAAAAPRRGGRDRGRHRCGLRGRALAAARRTIVTEGVWLWVTFALMAMTTVGTRGSFILLGEKGRLPPALQRALRYAPAAALSALVMPDLLLDG